MTPYPRRSTSSHAEVRLVLKYCDDDATIAAPHETLTEWLTIDARFVVELEACR